MTHNALGTTHPHDEEAAHQAHRRADWGDVFLGPLPHLVRLNRRRNRVLGGCTADSSSRPAVGDARLLLPRRSHPILQKQRSVGRAVLALFFGLLGARFVVVRAAQGCASRCGGVGGVA